jgi:hypothetical protein
VAIPTTYAGSEATNVWGMTENGQKTTGTDPRVLPATVIYDAALTLSLPPSLSVASGLNARHTALIRFGPLQRIRLMLPLRWRGCRLLPWACRP